LRESPELLAGLPFSESKRVIADMLVDKLVQKEQKYQQVSLMLMVEVASMESFPNIEQSKDGEDRTLRLGDARRAEARLRELTKDYAKLLSERDGLRQTRMRPLRKPRHSGDSLMRWQHYISGSLIYRARRIDRREGKPLSAS
jgi:hypothetical protein